MLDGDEWVMTAGPITPNEYDRLSSDAKSKSNRSDGIESLVKCPFDLFVDHEDHPGNIYISGRTFKLFIGMSVDDLILNNQLSSAVSTN